MQDCGCVYTGAIHNENGVKKMKTYAITTNTETRYIVASTRANAVSKLTGMSEKVSIEQGQIKSVKLCKD